MELWVRTAPPVGTVLRNWFELWSRMTLRYEAMPPILVKRYSWMKWPSQLERRFRLEPVLRTYRRMFCFGKLRRRDRQEDLPLRGNGRCAAVQK